MKMVVYAKLESGNESASDRDIVDINQYEWFMSNSHSEYKCALISSIGQDPRPGDT